MAKVQVSGECWLFTGHVRPEGYGSIRRVGRNGGTTEAHRLAYEVYVGPVPDGLHLHHTCGVRRCVNPDHLVLMDAKGHGHHHQPRRTHCVRGHVFDETGREPGNGACSECRRIRFRKKSA